MIVTFQNVIQIAIQIEVENLKKKKNGTFEFT